MTSLNQPDIIGAVRINPPAYLFLFCTHQYEVCKLTTPFKDGRLSDEKYFSIAIVPFETEAVENDGEVTGRGLLSRCFTICNKLWWR